MAKKAKKKPVKKAAKKAAKKTVKKAAKKPAKKTAKKVAKKPAKKAAKKSAPKKAAKPAKKKVVKKAAAKPAPKPEPKTNSISPYLNFKDNCEEAFYFYQSVFGGNFSSVNRFKEMPPMEGKSVPEEYGNKIMHISLPISKETALMGSDTVEGFGPPMVAGNNFFISINAKSQEEADRLYNGLSAGGHVIMPMSKTFWGSYFGMFADRYGINWMVSFDTGQKK